MRTLAVGLAILIVLSGVLLPALAQQTGSITPGRAIGPIELGMPMARAKEIIGDWGTVEEYDGPAGHGLCNPERGVGVCVYDRWQRLGLAGSDRVVFILTDDERFTTVPGGHKVGVALLDVLKTFGLYSSGAGTELLWDSQGLSVEVAATRSGLIVSVIGIYSPRSTAGARGRSAH
jgi:hypothetical protein